MRYEVLMITTLGEVVVGASHYKDEAFDLCASKWRARRTGGPAFAVLDTFEDQRWSYSDIKELAQ